MAVGNSKNSRKRGNKRHGGGNKAGKSAEEAKEIREEGQITPLLSVLLSIDPFSGTPHCRPLLGPAGLRPYKMRDGRGPFDTRRSSDGLLRANVQAGTIDAVEAMGEAAGRTTVSQPVPHLCGAQVKKARPVITSTRSRRSWGIPRFGSPRTAMGTRFR